MTDQIMAMRAALEAALAEVVDQTIGTDTPELRAMLRYHLGWEGEGSGPEAQGKRIRPLLALLTTHAAGGEWQNALPAAASVELIHNFSLIHDDIQDQSTLRRGRPTLWVKWGVAQAINAGDLMYTQAYYALTNLSGSIQPEDVVDALRLLQDTCIELTKGQFMDLWNEQEVSLPIESYWPMVGGKTAALLACCTQLGAIVAGASSERRKSFRNFGYQLGLAFQVQDDWLGIWGEAARTGKSTESDLVSRKKTLPVLYALQQKQRFAERWSNGPITAAEAPAMAQMLIDEGAQAYTEEQAHRLTKEALDALAQGSISVESGAALRRLALKLLGRKS